MTVKEAQALNALKESFKGDKVPLEHYSELVQQLYRPRLNLRNQSVELNGRPISEEEFEALHIKALEDHGLRFRKADLQAMVKFESRRAEYDPVRVYLDAVSIEGKPVLSDPEWRDIAYRCLGLRDGWSNNVLQKWFIAAAARVMDPGCKVDYALILHGGQGEQKSTFFYEVAKEYFTDSMQELSNVKDDLSILHRNWICEWQEVDSVFQGANKAERIKRFVSSREDSFRPPYGRTTQVFKRRSLLVATTNRNDFANDPTGNRRFPILSPTAIDNDWIRINRDRIWARAVIEYRKGTRWWFDKEEENRITEVARQFAPVNDEVEMVWDWLQRHSGEWLSTREILILALGKDHSALSNIEVRRFTTQLSGLSTRGLLTKKANHQSTRVPVIPRGRTTLWMVK